MSIIKKAINALTGKARADHIESKFTDLDTKLADMSRMLNAIADMVGYNRNNEPHDSHLKARISRLEGSLIATHRDLQRQINILSEHTPAPKSRDGKGRFKSSSATPQISPDLEGKDQKATHIPVDRSDEQDDHNLTPCGATQDIDTDTEEHQVIYGG